MDILVDMYNLPYGTRNGLVIPDHYALNTVTMTDYDVPALWLSYISGVAELIPFSHPPGINFTLLQFIAVSEYDFLWFDFIEDVFLYTSIVLLIPLLDYLIKLILHWRHGKSLTLKRNPVYPKD
jgi:hypothetical protein